MNLKKFAICLAFVLAASSAAFAQQASNRDENGKFIRHPYETNGFGANWWVGLAGGVNIFCDGGYGPGLGGALDVTVGKWFTPCVGGRIGYQGLTGSQFSDTQGKLSIDNPKEGAKYPYKDIFGFVYLHADAMWNVSNAIGGYKPERLWNFIPYAHGGFLDIYGRKGVEYQNREFAAGLGLLNNIRIIERLNATIDVRGTLYRGEAHTAVGGVAGFISVTAGLSVNLGKTTWNRGVSAEYAEECAKNEALSEANKALEEAKKALEDENAKLGQENDKLNEANDALEKENEELRNRPVAKDIPAVFYFEIGQTTLATKEQQHLEYYVNYQMDSDKPVKVIGCADNTTGSDKRNKQLSEQRAKYVADQLKSKYGFSEDNIEIEVIGATDKFANPALNRVVIIEQ